MTRERILLGNKGEQLAAQYLKKKGYRIIERNYRCKFGEVDIIARDGGTLSFIEVKSGRSLGSNFPKESITRRKQHQISKVATFYLQRKRLTETVSRFDVVLVQFSTIPEKIELIKGAFELTGV